MSIPDLLPYAQFFAQVSLIVAAGVALYQFVLVRRSRDEQNSLQVLTRMTSPEFRQAYARVWSLPLACPPEEVREHGPEMEEAIDCIMMTFEVLGVMVHNRMVHIDSVDQVIGGFLRESWRRLEPFVHLRREEVGSRRWGEWYQWLAEHLAVENRRGVGAYDAFRKWKA